MIKKISLTGLILFSLAVVSVWSFHLVSAQTNVCPAGYGSIGKDGKSHDVCCNKDPNIETMESRKLK
ncbi:MAG: hypothetical protein HYT48_03525 [Candidatus Vogelbacteria bacterium]|nr:hypothetical protein [Candidatus Vogelbacteria bacterium]